MQNTAKTEPGRKPGSQSQEEVKTHTSRTTHGAVSKALVFFFLILLPVTTGHSVINQLHSLAQTQSSELLLLGRTQLWGLGSPRMAVPAEEQIQVPHGSTVLEAVCALEWVRTKNLRTWICVSTPVTSPPLSAKAWVRGNVSQTFQVLHLGRAGAHGEFHTRMPARPLWSQNVSSSRENITNTQLRVPRTTALNQSQN